MSRRRRRFPAGARETKAEPQDGDAGISILLDGAPDHIPEARELWWRFIRLAPGIVLDAGAGHALWDELARDPRDVQGSRRFAAETSGGFGARAHPPGRAPAGDHWRSRRRRQPETVSVIMGPLGSPTRASQTRESRVTGLVTRSTASIAAGPTAISDWSGRPVSNSQG